MSYAGILSALSFVVFFAIGPGLFITYVLEEAIQMLINSI